MREFERNLKRAFRKMNSVFNDELDTFPHRKIFENDSFFDDFKFESIKNKNMFEDDEFFKNSNLY